MNNNKIREIREIRENPRFRRYSKYKESGIEWVKEIPGHWRLSRIDSLFFRRKEKNANIISDNILSVLKDRGVIRYADKGNIGNKVSDNIENYQLVYADDIVVNNMNVTIGSVGKSDQFGALSGIYIVLAPKRDSVNMNYYEYVFKVRSFQKSLIQISSGILEIREALNFIQFKALKLPAPPSSEQTQIVNFLDRKTEQIDKLIRIKERRIELLQEQRTALINQAVTKGLDPNVEMKPSGVEWIGEIPVHWKVKRLKHIAKILPSNVDKHIYPDEIQVRLCNYTDVYYNDYITVDTVLKKGSCKESEFAKFALRKGDIIITKDSETPDDIGVPTFVKEDLDNVVCGYHLTMIRSYACRGEFIFRFIQSDRTRRYFEVNSNGITRYGLGKASIENLLLPIPPDSEQRQIADFLNNKTQQIDELIATEQRKIELLKEYRQSLISEAVTGKIDVRNEG